MSVKRRINLNAIGAKGNIDHDRIMYLLNKYIEKIISKIAEKNNTLIGFFDKILTKLKVVTRTQKLYLIVFRFKEISKEFILQKIVSWKQTGGENFQGLIFI